MEDCVNKNEAGIPASPCVRNCCLDPQDICLGCFRHLDEITQWQSMSVKRKKDTLRLCASRKQAHEEHYS
ncbi:DUF1289 domain-containing protein [Thalassotalea atypica]|uniref:DUF1289 domain-containing protein n=1 Tax=Thalassotalea atypica TaxID=2054316 RepID=UPI00257475B4|nr:DUF1289 domain-containing protein [Thalassotalea atypica]